MSLMFMSEIQKARLCLASACVWLEAKGACHHSAS